MANDDIVMHKVCNKVIQWETGCKWLQLERCDKEPYIEYVTLHSAAFVQAKNLI